jgi:N-acyl-phosphatidylethanolamine-hydrolysing phospholipase D
MIVERFIAIAPTLIGRFTPQVPEKTSSAEDLPPIDAVLISHNHFDHLDLPTLRQLGTRGRSAFVLVARCARLLRSQGIESVHELDWGGSLAISGVTIHCAPALHFSARG